LETRDPGRCPGLIYIALSGLKFEMVYCAGRPLFCRSLEEGISIMFESLSKKEPAAGSCRFF